jgi:hypothetical protein
MIDPLRLRGFFQDAARSAVGLNATVAGGFRNLFIKSHLPAE